MRPIRSTFPSTSFRGTITEFLANPEDTVEVGQPLFKLEPGEGGAPKAAAPKETPKEEPKEEVKKEEPKKEAAPAAAPAAPAAPAPKKAAPAPAPAAESKPVQAGSRGETRVKMNRMRLRIAERLKESQNTAASLTTFSTRLTCPASWRCASFTRMRSSRRPVP